MIIYDCAYLLLLFWCELASVRLVALGRSRLLGTHLDHLFGLKFRISSSAERRYNQDRARFQSESEKPHAGYMVNRRANAWAGTDTSTALPFPPCSMKSNTQTLVDSLSTYIVIALLLLCLWPLLLASFGRRLASRLVPLLCFLGCTHHAYKSTHTYISPSPQSHYKASLTAVYRNEFPQTTMSSTSYRTWK